MFRKLQTRILIKPTKVQVANRRTSIRADFASTDCSWLFDPSKFLCRRLFLPPLPVFTPRSSYFRGEAFRGEKLLPPSPQTRYVFMRVSYSDEKFQGIKPSVTFSPFLTDFAKRPENYANEFILPKDQPTINVTKIQCVTHALFFRSIR